MHADVVGGVEVQLFSVAPQANVRIEPAVGEFLQRRIRVERVQTGFVALRPGSHKYMFIVDGERWVTDPGAERYVDDGFGMQNAVITVAPPTVRAL